MPYLRAMPGKRVRCCLWVQANARDEDLCANLELRARDDSGSQQPILDDTVNHQTRPIAQTLTWVEITKQHHRHPALESQLMRRKPSVRLCVE
eukprot:6747589-Prymnesium_polylepis.1